jgi:hypothetical protein
MECSLPLSIPLALYRPTYDPVPGTSPCSPLHCSHVFLPKCQMAIVPPPTESLIPPKKIINEHRVGALEEQKGNEKVILSISHYCLFKVGEFAVVMATTTKNAKLTLSILDTWHENNSFQVSTPEKEQQLLDARNNSLLIIRKEQ